MICSHTRTHDDVPTVNISARRRRRLPNSSPGAFAGKTPPVTKQAHNTYITTLCDVDDCDGGDGDDVTSDVGEHLTMPLFLENLMCFFFFFRPSLHLSLDVACCAVAVGGKRCKLICDVTLMLTKARRTHAVHTASRESPAALRASGTAAADDESLRVRFTRQAPRTSDSNIIQHLSRSSSSNT